MPFFCAFGLIFHKRKLNFLQHGIDSFEQHAHPLSHVVGFPAALADDLLGIFVIRVAVVGERGKRDQAFDEEVHQFDKHAELGDADDQTLKFLAYAVLHEFDLLPLHQLAFGVIGPAFGKTRLLRDFVQHFYRD